MIQDAIDAFADIFSPPFRRVLFKSMALTVALLVLVGFGARSPRGRLCRELQLVARDR